MPNKSTAGPTVDASPVPPSPSIALRSAIDSRARALCETYRQHAALGSRITNGPRCTAIRNDAAAAVYDANVLQVGTDADLDEAFAFHESELGDRAYRNVYTDPSTPPAFPAELSLRGYAPDATLQLLLEGELLGPPPRDFDIRPVTSDADWRTLGGLFREDHIETDKRLGTKIFSAELTKEMVGVHRAASSDVDFVMVWEGDEAIAFFSSWSGRNGVGIVEDLYTQPEHRNRGIARALIHHCVGVARAKGAGPVLIGAEPGDTPKNIYAAMGFAPTCLTYSWVRRVAPLK